MTGCWKRRYDDDGEPAFAPALNLKDTEILAMLEAGSSREQLQARFGISKQALNHKLTLLRKRLGRDLPGEGSLTAGGWGKGRWKAKATT